MDFATPDDTPHRPWLAQYPEGVPHEVDPSPYRSLAALLESSLKQHADRPVSVCMDRWMSYGQLDEHSAALGAWLQARGMPADARVAVMLPNIPQFLVAMTAILRAGYTVVNVNPLYTARELEHQLKDSGAEAIVILENFGATLEEVIDHTPIRHVVVASMGDMLGFWYGRWISFAVRHLAKMVPPFRLSRNGAAGPRTIAGFRQALAEGSALSLRPGAADHDSIAFLQYTGGTTGLSKGAVLTHRNVIAATLQAEAWFRPALGQASAMCGRSTHCRPAAVSHLRAHPVPADDALGGAHDAHAQPARHPASSWRRSSGGPSTCCRPSTPCSTPCCRTLSSANSIFRPCCMSQAGGMAASPRAPRGNGRR
jgi:long-chain acyl-CoA synthetase